MMASVVTAALLTGALVFAPAAVATDDWTAEELAASISSLKDGIVGLDPSIEPFSDVQKDEGTTTIALSSDVLFAFGSADLSPAAAAKIGDALADAPQRATVSVGGHTDAVGDDAANLTLSQKRAENVAAAIRAARGDLVLDVTGFGETQPIEPNEKAGSDNPAGREKNRRVTVSYAG